MEEDKGGPKVASASPRADGVARPSRFPCGGSDVSAAGLIARGDAAPEELAPCRRSRFRRSCPESEVSTRDPPVCAQPGLEPPPPDRGEQRERRGRVHRPRLGDHARIPRPGDRERSPRARQRSSPAAWRASLLRDSLDRLAARSAHRDLPLRDFTRGRVAGAPCRERGSRRLPRRSF